ncbi:hypothetical protein [Aeromonas dhakensis]|uniref:hypothetical protein n=1 Tax=Aeromonas dhakensis TaxID=196024 RepID=UPI000AF635E7|nr:hypothetical protein [Aeromonas dhakensis]
MSKKVKMNTAGRTYSGFANDKAKADLEKLLEFTSDPVAYKQTMTGLGKALGVALNERMKTKDMCLVVSTAEDADFLSKGVIDALSCHGKTILAAVFWNNHYHLNGGSVAPIFHQYIQPGYETAETLVVVKSVISGSCVVRTNILALIDSIKVNKIYIASPVMHTDAKEALCSEFPHEISSKFEFIYFAEDEKKLEDGEVVPGIGGQIYSLLAMKDQPVKTGYMPELVIDLINS